MPNPRIILTEEADVEPYLKGRVEIQFLPDLRSDSAALAEALVGAAGLVVRNETKVTSDVLKLTKSLQVVGRLGGGLDNIDVAAVRARGAEVVYAPDANTVSVAEYCVAQIIGAVRLLPWAAEATRNGDWDRAKFTGREMSQVTVGIVGYGRIGSKLADLLEAFGTRILVNTRRQETVPPHLEAKTLKSLLESSDVVSLNVPASPSTKHLINEQTLSQMRPGSVLINTSRGSAVDEAALSAALSTGHITAAILDVRATEPPNSPELAEVPTVISTPHIAAFTSAAQERVNETVASDILRILEGRDPEYPAP